MKSKVLALFAPLLIGSSLLLAQRPGIAPDAEHVTPLMPGQKVPDVTFKTLDGSDYKLLDEVAKKPVLLIFYRGGW
jgi:hypothetical protein